MRNCKSLGALSAIFGRQAHALHSPRALNAIDIWYGVWSTETSGGRLYNFAEDESVVSIILIWVQGGAAAVSFFCNYPAAYLCVSTACEEEKILHRLEAF